MEVKLRRANRRRFFCSVLALAILALCAALNFSHAQEPEGVRADLPANGNLRVENLRGDITLEVWNENFVSISATVEGQQRSPAVIQRTERLLSIRVPPGTRAKATRVDLTVRIPVRSHAAIITTGGAVRIPGV